MLFMKVSYLIVDEADEDLEMAGDPFLDAGIDIPADLPYQGTPETHKSKEVENVGIATQNATDTENAFQNIRKGSIRLANIVCTEKRDETKSYRNSDEMHTTEDNNVIKDNYLTSNYDVSNNSSQTH